MSTPTATATECVIRAVTPFITTFSIPFSRFGVLPIGNRSTAIKLANDEVFLIVSSPCTSETTSVIDSMGQVKYLLTPDYEHGMHILDFHNKYPEAKCIGPQGIEEKKPLVPWAGILGSGGEDKVYGFENEIKLHYFPGHANREIALLHIPSRTLVVADLLFNLPPKEQYSNTTKSPTAWWPLSILGNGMQPGSKTHETVIGAIAKDKA